MQRCAKQRWEEKGFAEIIEWLQPKGSHYIFLCRHCSVNLVAAGNGRTVRLRCGPNEKKSSCVKIFCVKIGVFPSSFFRFWCVACALENRARMHANLICFEIGTLSAHDVLINEGGTEPLSTATSQANQKAKNCTTTNKILMFQNMARKCHIKCDVHRK